MGVFTRPDSPWYWLWLEAAPPGAQREKTKIRIGTTARARHDSRALALAVYHARANELASRIYKLPSAVPQTRFSAYAATYRTNTIAHHRGAGRERELLATLVNFFGTDDPDSGAKDDLLSLIDQDRVKAYFTWRRPKASARSVNREVDLLKSMLRDAVPKYLSASPLAGMKRLPIVKPKRRLLSRAEERALLKVGDRQDRALLILGIDTMIRLSDLLDLQRSDRAGVWLYVKDPKGGEPYEVALTKRAAAALTAIRGEASYFFTKFRRAENPRDWPGAVRQRLQLLCARATPPITYGRKPGGITWHWATRRTGATRMLMRRVPLPVVQKQGNWKTPDVLLEIYAEAQRDDQLSAVGQPLPAHSRSKAKGR